MQSQPQADKLPVISEKQTSPDSLESTNDEDNNNASPQPGADDNQSFLGPQAPTLQDT